jgi:23S rRNA (uracil1939-C5)-methyltransferase
MMVEYAAQLAQKKQWLTKALARLQSADCEPEVMAAPQPLGYRNRAQLKTDGERLGFSAAGTRAIVDVPVCLVLNAGCQAELSALRAQLPNSQWRPRKGREWSTLDLDDSGRPPLLNQRQPFRQGNDVQNQRMQAWVVEQLQRMSSPEKTVELFCGSGNFTQLLCASTSGKVVAVEGVAATLAPLATQASNQLLPVVGDLYDEDFVRTLTHGHQDAELLFLDPPRDGLRHRQALLAGLPQLTDVLYISCNIATWERDCRDFIAGGFRVESLGLVDLFPHTPHVEILSRLRRAP